jgi:hypothetical protein
MRIKFTSKDDPNDFWIEEYESLEEITEEMKEGCDLVVVFKCNGCLKDVESEDLVDAHLGLCKQCSTSMDDHITESDEE